jgi:cyclic pyranopterin phosphate synthase
MFDRFDRRIHYLRISVTDRCNLRCVYCMPAEGVPLVRHEDVLSFEDICLVTRAAVDMGVDKVRVTGGEPLVRRDISVLVEMLAGIEGIRDLAMTTNGVLLEEFAPALRHAGLHRVNVSLDTLDPQRYRRITRGGELERALAGIDAAVAAGLTPVKLNCVVEESSSEPDAQEVAAFARDKGLEARFIHRMHHANGRFWPVEGGAGGDCPRCNRLRLSSNGMIRPCLFSDPAFSVRKLGPSRAIRMALEAKPEAGETARRAGLYEIGG